MMKKNTHTKFSPKAKCVLCLNILSIEIATITYYGLLKNVKYCFGFVIHLYALVIKCRNKY